MIKEKNCLLIVQGSLKQAGSEELVERRENYLVCVKGACSIPVSVE